MAVDCKPIASRGVAEIGVADIKAIVEPCWRRRNLRRAKTLLGRIEMVFDYAIAHGWRKADNPASWRTFQHIAPHAPSGAPPHHAAMPWTDVPETVRRLRANESVSARILEFIILTATRSGEARGARCRRSIGTTAPGPSRSSA
jgi:integrase